MRLRKRREEEEVQHRITSLTEHYSPNPVARVDAFNHRKIVYTFAMIVREWYPSYYYSHGCYIVAIINYQTRRGVWAQESRAVAFLGTTTNCCLIRRTIRRVVLFWHVDLGNAQKAVLTGVVCVCG